MTALDLTQFSGGTGKYYRHSLNRKVVFTDGVKYVADEAGAYWLIDKIALTPVKGPFQVWKLEVKGAAGTGKITVEDGNNNVLRKEKLSFTDFPEPGVTIWFIDNTILLPCEY